MEDNGITIEESNDKYYLSHYKCFPANFQDWICRKLNMAGSDYINLMEKEYNGQDYCFDIIVDDYDENDNRVYRVFNSWGISFENIEDANKAKDWVDAQFLAKRMSEPQMLIGVDYGYGYVEIEPVFVDSTGRWMKNDAHDRTKLERTKNELLSCGLRNKQKFATSIKTDNP